MEKINDSGAFVISATGSRKPTSSKVQLLAEQFYN